MLGRRHEGMRRAGLLGALVALGVMPYARAGGMPCFVGTARVGLRGARGPSCCPVRTRDVALAAAKTKTKTKQGKAAPSSGGFGAKKAVTTTVDAAALLRKSMDLYDAIERESAVAGLDDEDGEDAPGLREYVVCVRSKAHDAVNDWVPAACMCVAWQGGDVSENPLLRGMADCSLFAPIAAKLHCREVWESACQAAPSLRKISRNSIEYAYEPLDNFGAVLEEVDAKGASTSKAYQVLGVAKGASAAEIKSAHRKLIVSLHPDAVAALPAEEQAEARKKFEEVQAAYESLGGGAGDSVESWYENLGSGRADYFSGPVDLTKPIDGSILDYWTAAVCPLDAELTNKFIMRNVVRKTLAAA